MPVTLVTWLFGVTTVADVSEAYMSLVVHLQPRSGIFVSAAMLSASLGDLDSLICGCSLLRPIERCWIRDGAPLLWANYLYINTKNCAQTSKYLHSSIG